MATVPPKPTTPEPGRFSIRLPRPLWIGVATVGLVAGIAGVRFGVPIYRKQTAMSVADVIRGRSSVHQRNQIMGRGTFVYGALKLILRLALHV